MKVLVTAAVLLVGSTSLGADRIWSLKGSLVGADANGMVRLRLATGHEIIVPLAALGTTDQRLVRGAATGQQPAAAQPAQRAPVNAIPPDVLARIRAKAAADFPDDFSVQRYQIQQESQAWLAVQNYANPGIPSAVFASIVQKARRDFPEDYGVQKYQIEQEIAAYRDLQR